MKYKIGEKGKILKCSQYDPNHIGQIGKVCYLYSDGNIVIEFEDGICAATRVKRVKETQDKLKKKKTEFKYPDPKCPKTLTGKHRWIEPYQYEVYGVKVWTRRECQYCGVIDDRRKPTHG